MENLINHDSDEDEVNSDDYSFASHSRRISFEEVGQYDDHDDGFDDLTYSQTRNGRSIDFVLNSSNQGGNDLLAQEGTAPVLGPNVLEVQDMTESQRHCRSNYLNAEAEKRRLSETMDVVESRMQLVALMEESQTSFQADCFNEEYNTTTGSPKKKRGRNRRFCSPRFRIFLVVTLVLLTIVASAIFLKREALASASLNNLRTNNGKHEEETFTTNKWTTNPDDYKSKANHDNNDDAPRNPPSNIPDPDCKDNPAFRYFGHAGKNCKWVARAATESRCQGEGVMENCRVTCDPSCSTGFPTEAPTGFPTLLETDVDDDEVYDDDDIDDEEVFEMEETSTLEPTSDGTVWSTEEDTEDFD